MCSGRSRLSAIAAISSASCHARSNYASLPSSARRSCSLCSAISRARHVDLSILRTHPGPDSRTFLWGPYPKENQPCGSRIRSCQDFDDGSTIVLEIRGDRSVSGETRLPTSPLLDGAFGRTDPMAFSQLLPPCPRPRRVPRVAGPTQSRRDSWRVWLPLTRRVRAQTIWRLVAAS